MLKFIFCMLSLCFICIHWFEILLGFLQHVIMWLPWLLCGEAAQTQDLPVRILCCLETTHLRSVRRKTPEGRNQMLVRARWRALHSLSPLKHQPSSPTPSRCCWPPLSSVYSFSKVNQSQPPPHFIPKTTKRERIRMTGDEPWAFNPVFLSGGVSVSFVLALEQCMLHLHCPFIIYEDLINYNMHCLNVSFPQPAKITHQCMTNNHGHLKHIYIGYIGRMT